jgi:hypothetical protein
MRGTYFLSFFFCCIGFAQNSVTGLADSNKLPKIAIHIAVTDIDGKFHYDSLEVPLQDTGNEYFSERSKCCFTNQKISVVLREEDNLQ